MDLIATTKLAWLFIAIVFCTYSNVFAVMQLQPAKEDDVQAIDEALRLNILTRVSERIETVTSLQKTTVEACEQKIIAETKECETCFKKCQENEKPNMIDLNTALALISPAYALSIGATEIIVSTASNALKHFSGDSLKYMQKVGHIAEKLGKSLLKDGDRLLRTTGKTLEHFGRNLEDASKKLIEQSAKGLQHVSKQVVNVAKDAIKGIEKAARPLLKGTGEILKGVGKIAGDTVSGIGKGISRAGSQLVDIAGKTLSGGGKLVGSIVKEIFNPRLPRFHLPRINLPRVRFDLPRINLPRVRFGFPRFRGWGKKRNSCSCGGCDIFKEGESQTNMIGTVCGVNYLVDQEKSINELNSLIAMNNYTANHNILQEILMDLSSLRNTDNGYFIGNAIMKIALNNDVTVNMKMVEGMPFGQTLNASLVASVEGPAVYRKLRRSFTL